MYGYRLSNARGAEVDRSAIPNRRLLITSDKDEFLFPKLVTGKFGTTLDKVADGGRTKAGQECRGPFFSDDKAASGEEMVARKGGVYLDPCLHDIDRL
jgi:hypothetical protein